MRIGGWPGRPVLRVRDARPGTAISVKAVNARGMESWDWATVFAP